MFVASFPTLQGFSVIFYENQQGGKEYVFASIIPLG